MHRMGVATWVHGAVKSELAGAVSQGQYLLSSCLELSNGGKAGSCQTSALSLQCWVYECDIMVSRFMFYLSTM